MLMEGTIHEPAVLLKFVKGCAEFRKIYRRVVSYVTKGR